MIDSEGFNIFEKIQWQLTGRCVQKFLLCQHFLPQWLRDLLCDDELSAVKENDTKGKEQNPTGRKRILTAARATFLGKNRCIIIFAFETEGSFLKSLMASNNSKMFVFILFFSLSIKRESLSQYTEDFLHYFEVRN
jgi:hypothetical protein